MPTSPGSQPRPIESSPRQFATSWEGKPLYYSLAGDAGTVAAADEVAAVQQELRDPRPTDAARAAEIASDSPAIAWYVDNTGSSKSTSW
jgi:hypothetical protein